MHSRNHSLEQITQRGYRFSLMDRFKKWMKSCAKCSRITPLEQGVWSDDLLWYLPAWLILWSCVSVVGNCHVISINILVSYLGKKYRSIFMVIILFKLNKINMVMNNDMANGVYEQWNWKLFQNENWKLSGMHFFGRVTESQLPSKAKSMRLSENQVLSLTRQMKLWQDLVLLRRI